MDQEAPRLDAGVDGGAAEAGPAGGGGGANDVSCARAHSVNVNSEWARAQVMLFASR